MNPVNNENIYYAKSFLKGKVFLTSEVKINGKNYSFTIKLEKYKNLTEEKERNIFLQCIEVLKNLAKHSDRKKIENFTVRVNDDFLMKNYFDDSSKDNKEQQFLPNEQLLNVMKKDGDLELDCVISLLDLDPLLSESKENLEKPINFVKLLMQKIERDNFKLNKIVERNKEKINQLKKNIEGEKEILEELLTLSLDEEDPYIINSRKSINNYQDSINTLEEENLKYREKIVSSNEEIKLLTNEIAEENEGVAVDFLTRIKKFISSQSSYSLSLLSNPNIEKNSFPTNYIAEKVNEENYDILFKYTCHVTALAVTEFLKKEHIIESTPYSQLRENDLQAAKNLLSTDFSVHRILTELVKGGTTHEFIVANFGKSLFLIQSDHFTGKELKHPAGVIEMTQEHIEKLFNNDSEMYEDFFDFSSKRTPSFTVLALDSYRVL